MITITPKIEKMLDGHKDRAKWILSTAWDLCCDPYWLVDFIAYGGDVDPWDGKHDELSMSIEAEAVEQAIEAAYA